MDNREELKNWILDNTHSIINDCLALVEHRNEEHLTGGGNFLIPTGLFAVINFLCKVYSHLLYRHEFVSKENVEKQKDQKVKVSIKELKPLGINTLPEGACKNEQKAFVTLIKASKTIKILDKLTITRDPNEEELKHIWNDFRVKLAHFGRPAGPTISFGYAAQGKTISFSEIKNLIFSSPRATFDNTVHERAKFICFADLLIRDVSNTADWLADEINDASKIDDDRIKNTLVWLKQNLPI